MFTVIIAEEGHIKSIEKYSLFLGPLLDKKDTKILKWNRSGRSFKDCVPELEATIAYQKDWRAIVLCGQDALKQKNPFDFVECELPQKPAGSEEGNNEPDYDSLVEYYERVRTVKFEAYRKAAERPLTKLMTYLCEPPLATGGINHGLVIETGKAKLSMQGFEGEDFKAQEERLLREQLEYDEYISEAKEKERLRKEIIGSELCDIILPKQVLCIALRTRRAQEHDLKEQWNPHVNHQYNRFYDWNLYFDKMRYLVFDILPRENRRYELNYIHYLSTVLLIANNEMPPDALRPNQVYVLGCDSDDRALEKMLLEYDAKLTLTEEMLERSIADQKRVTDIKMSDSEAERLYRSKVTIPVSTNSDFDRAQLYAKSDGIGLAADCPDSEYRKWKRMYGESVFALGRFLKQPRRALQKSVKALHDMSSLPTDQCRRLDSFQIEDIAEHVYEEELDMIETKTQSIYDVERYYRKLEDADRVVVAKIDQRMTKKRSIAIGVSALLLYLVSFIPMIIGGIRDGTFAEVFPLVLLPLFLLTLAALICLFCLRIALVRLIKKFNVTMKEIEDDIDYSLTQFSRYLSHACNAMRGYCVLDFCNKEEEPNLRTIRLIHKHQNDIRRQRAIIRDSFKWIIDRCEKNPELRTQEPYWFDYSKTADYEYPMCYHDGLKRKIMFIQSGNQIESPVSYIKEITVKLEELYD